MTPGLIALLVALACAAGGGVLWRRSNGRMRSVNGGPEPRGAGAGLPIETAVGDLVAEAPEPDVRRTPDLTAELLGEPLGARATLVQFSSAFCAPCRATRRILADVAAMTEGIAHIEIDAESRLDLVRRLNVLRTPTVLVADSAGRVVKRASGQPRKPDVIAAVGAAVDSGFPHIYDRETS